MNHPKCQDMKKLICFVCQTNFYLLFMRLKFLPNINVIEASYDVSLLSNREMLSKKLWQYFENLWLNFVLTSQVITGRFFCNWCWKYPRDKVIILSLQFIGLAFLFGEDWIVSGGDRIAISKLSSSTWIYFVFILSVDRLDRGSPCNIWYQRNSLNLLACGFREKKSSFFIHDKV